MLDAAGGEDGNTSAIEPTPAFDRAARAAFAASMIALTLPLLVLCIFGCLQLNSLRRPATVHQAREAVDPRSERTTVQRWAHGLNKRQKRLRGRLERALTSDYTSPEGYQTRFPPFVFTPSYLQIAVILIPCLLLLGASKC